VTSNRREQSTAFWCYIAPRNQPQHTPPTAGRILLDGTDIWSLSETERAGLRHRYIGFAFQFPSLPSNLEVVDNVRGAGDAWVYLGARGMRGSMIYLPASISGTAPTPIRTRCPEASSARVLINSSRLLLTDGPPSHLGEDGEADTMELDIGKPPDEPRSLRVTNPRIRV
jgi:putative ABC transport system ATP-binding protein